MISTTTTITRTDVMKKSPWRVIGWMVDVGNKKSRRVACSADSTNDVDRRNCRSSRYRPTTP